MKTAANVLKAPTLPILCDPAVPFVVQKMGADRRTGRTTKPKLHRAGAWIAGDYDSAAMGRSTGLRRHDDSLWDHHAGHHIRITVKV